MLATIVWRLVRTAITLLISSFVIFVMVYLAPGNPVALLTGGRTLDPTQLKALEAQYGLDKPLFARYLDWLGNVLRGDFGVSLAYQGTDVGSLLGARAGVTIFLVLYAALLVVVVGGFLGVIAGLRGGRVDSVVSMVTTTGLATPPFVAAIVFITVFSVNLGWFPALGGGTGFSDRLWHTTLPAIALALSGIAYVTGITRTAVRAELGSEHIITARARGVPGHAILRRHVLRNASIPMVTVSGLALASLVAYAAVVETAFGLQGLGSFLVQSVLQKDYAVVQAVSLILVVVFIVINGLVDALYPLIDPRLRRSAT